MRTSETVFSSPWISVEALWENPDAEPYYRVVDGHGVICIALTAEGDFAMVSQERPAIGRRTLEFPAGRVDPGETPVMAMQRELREETGLEIDAVAHILTCEPVPSRLLSRQDIFVVVCAPPDSLSEEKRHERDVWFTPIARSSLQRSIETEDAPCIVALGGITMLRLKYEIDLFMDPIDQIRSQLLEIKCSKSVSSK